MRIGIIGLGYVGLPLAVAFAKKYQVKGLDINRNRIKRLKQMEDDTKELSKDELKQVIGSSLNLSTRIEDLKECNIYIITVPTPVTENKTPNLLTIELATESIGSILKKGDIVVYESTVYPGVTEDICVPILEKKSNLKFNIDFFVGYSPERINPGDKQHTITKIKKVVSGSNPDCLKTLSDLYGSIIEAGIYEAPSIKIAEAAKVIENTQRDINIAFVNELSMIFGKMGIDTKEVLKAAGTKWNFLNFFPGLVGGHCIGVDPYYLAYKSQEIGHNPEMILAGRRINDLIPSFIVASIIKKVNKLGKSNSGINALILGATFKENCPDLRNSKVYDIFNEFSDFGITPKIYDPLASVHELSNFYHADNVLPRLNSATKFDVIVLAVSHDELINIDLKKISFDNSIIFDVKGIHPISKGYLRL
jgi:UDP-N-acetyl-D-glucosamine/UDP-N-acetyl-D-galactosamine dehydrogenase